MKRCIPFFLILFLLSGFTGCLAKNAAQGQAGALDKQKQAQDPYYWNFGKARQGEMLRHAFILKNPTKNVLKIQQVTTSCGCTASEVKKNVLAPQESTEIEVTFNTKNYSGIIKQYIYVNTDSLREPIIRLTIEAEVLK